MSTVLPSEYFFCYPNYKHQVSCLMTIDLLSTYSCVPIFLGCTIKPMLSYFSLSNEELPIFLFSSVCFPPHMCVYTCICVCMHAYAHVYAEQNVIAWVLFCLEIPAAKQISALLLYSVSLKFSRHGQMQPCQNITQRLSCLVPNKVCIPLWISSLKLHEPGLQCRQFP